MNIANRMGIPIVVALIGAVLGLTLVVLGSPTHVAAQSGSDPEAYVTVVITSSDDTVSWSDPDECTSDYNTYLKVTSGPGTGTKSRTHIGSVASGSTEATQSLVIGAMTDGTGLCPPQRASITRTSPATAMVVRTRQCISFDLGRGRLRLSMYGG